MKAKKILGLGLTLALLAGAGLAKAGDLRFENPALYANLRDSTFAPLFAAMKAGDLATIKQYLPGAAYGQYRALFEKNRNYGQFLRNYYAGATFDLGPIVTANNNDFVAEVRISWPSGRMATVKLHVAPGAGATPAGTETPTSVRLVRPGSAAYTVTPENERSRSTTQKNH
jgi:hypothetical protein